MTTTETRLGGNAPGLPGLPPPAPLPGLVGAFSRRRAIFGAVAVAAAPVAAEARALHARRALEAALDHGTALLAALGLPRLVDAGFVQVDGDALGDALDVVISHLDAIDAPEADLEDDDPLEKVGDDELDLGWSALHSQLALGNNTADGDATALETYGAGFRQSGPDDAEDDDPGGTDESGIADLDGYHEQCGFAVAGALPWSVGGYVA